MKIPKKLKIGGHWIKIKKVNNRMKQHGDGKMGTSFMWNNTIWLDTDAAIQQQESTLIHEILEMIKMMNDLSFDHKELCVLETALYQVLNDNKLLK